MTKHCSGCKTVKPLTEFGSYRNSCGNVKPAIYCRPCVRIKDRSVSSRFSQSKAKARTKGYDWKLTIEEFAAIIIQPCRYCGGPLPETGKAIDRWDNDIDYLPGNCVPCCALCNQAKSASLRGDEMVLIGAAIRQIRENRTAAGLPQPETWLAIHNGERKANKYTDSLPEEK